MLLRHYFCGLAFFLFSFPLQAATITRDGLERHLLDTCVYRQYLVKEIQRATMVEKCRCASKKAMQGLEGETFDQPRGGGITGPQEKAIRAGIAACFGA